MNKISFVKKVFLFIYSEFTLNSSFLIFRMNAQEKEK